MKAWTSLPSANCPSFFLDCYFSFLGSLLPRAKSPVDGSVTSSSISVRTNDSMGHDPVGVSCSASFSIPPHRSATSRLTELGRFRILLASYRSIGQNRSDVFIVDVSLTTSALHREGTIESCATAFRSGSSQYPAFASQWSFPALSSGPRVSLTKGYAMS